MKHAWHIQSNCGAASQLRRHKRHIVLKAPSAEIAHCFEHRFQRLGCAPASTVEGKPEQPFFAKYFARRVGGFGDAVSEKSHFFNFAYPIAVPSNDGELTY